MFPFCLMLGLAVSCAVLSLSTNLPINPNGTSKSVLSLSTNLQINPNSTSKPVYNHTMPSTLFYLYPLEQFPLFWGKNSSCDHAKSKTPKHDHAEFAWRAMMRHPWRTVIPEQAQLAILPLSLDLLARGGCKDIPVSQVIDEIKSVLKVSTIFPSVRHLVIANDFKTTNLMRKGIMDALHPAGIWAWMEGRGDCYTSLGYTSNYAVFMSLRAPNEVRMPNPAPLGSHRIFSINMVGQVDERRAYSDRLALFQSNGSIPASYIVATKEDSVAVHQSLRMCNATTRDTDRCLMQKLGRFETQHAQELSNYTLCLRGDTLGSDRWINAMTAGTALIQVADNVDEAISWLPFPNVIPWKDLVITIPRKKYLEDPAKALLDVIENTPESRLLELQQLSLYYAADVDWTAHNSRVTENLVHEALDVPCKAFDTKVGLSKKGELTNSNGER